MKEILYTSLLYNDEALYDPSGDASLFDDLHIDQILCAVTEGFEEFDLNDFYHHRPIRKEDAAFRTEISGDLLNDQTRREMKKYLAGFMDVRRFLRTGASIHDEPIRKKWKLDAAVIYVETIEAMCQRKGIKLSSQGLTRFFAWLCTYAESDAFILLRQAAVSLKTTIDDISYALHLDIENNVVCLKQDDKEGDLCADFTSTFAHYDLRHVSRTILAFADVNMNMLERRVLALLQNEHPELWRALDVFDTRFDDFVDERIWAFERELYFYISYIEYTKRLGEKGFFFALSHYSDSGELHITGGYDASLALNRDSAAQVVHNDFDIAKGEGSFLLTGPNQGGKTTFSRMFGQILFFASLGLPVPCQGAELFFSDGLATHFNVEENPADGSGRLKEELKRLHRIIASTPDRSVVILNELFSSATTSDALNMGKRILRLFEKKNCVCLYVTHLFELAEDSNAVSLVAEVTEGNAPTSTYKIRRGPTLKNAFAERLLAEHRLRHNDIKERTHAAFAAQP